MLRMRLDLIVLAVSLLLTSTSVVTGQVVPNPYRQDFKSGGLGPADPWAKLPAGRTMGAAGDLKMDPDGRHLWAVIRCDATAVERFGNECLDSDLDPIVKFDLDGNAVDSFGSGTVIWPHGIDVDQDGNVWVADAVAEQRTPEGTRGHQVIKFSPTGELLMRLGTPGKAGGGRDHFNSPADVVVGENGDIFVADGHGNNGNNRVVKFSKDGTYLTEWGGTGSEPGEFRGLHAIEIGPDGRLYVADRSNNRIQIFDQEGEFIDQWAQFGRPSGIAFDDHGRIYVSDSESDDFQNPGFEMGIRVGELETGWVTAFILYPWGDPRDPGGGTGAEFVAVDGEGNIYGGEPRPRRIQKYVRVRP